jgi:flagellar brake protein
MDKASVSKAEAHHADGQSADGDSHNSRYAIWSRSEILHILTSIREQNALVNLSTDRTGDAFLSSMIDIDPQANLLVMDPAQNQAVNERFVRDQKVVFETTLDQVRVYFTAERAWHCIHKGEAGICMHIPESLVRLQRRDYFRIRLPSSRPVLCAIPAQRETGGSEWLAAIVDDISLGGIAILLNQGEMNADYGMALTGCRFSLPDIGEIEADLEIRNITQLSLNKGGKKIRLGCQFISLSNAVENKLQRYIIKLECERRARTGN